MPRSRSKRSSYRPPEPAKEKRSPRWVPAVGLALIVLGIVLILLTYIVSLPGAGLNLLIGFGLMAAGLMTLSRYR